MVTTVGDDHSGTVFDGDTFSAQEFQLQLVHVHWTEGDLGRVP
jgi:hypothetical protein